MSTLTHHGVLLGVAETLHQRHLGVGRAFHLFRYLDEQAYRWNHRKKNDGQRFLTAVRGLIGKRLTYDQLRGRTGRGRKPTRTRQLS